MLWLWVVWLSVLELIEIGKVLICMVWDLSIVVLNCDCILMVLWEVLVLIRCWDRIRKFWVLFGRWKFIRLVFSRFWMILVCYGICINSFIGGNGMCKKKLMVRLGCSMCSIFGISCSW